MDKRIYVLTLVNIAAGVATFVHAGLLAALVADLGVPLAAGGHIATVYGITFALAAPVLAGLTARFERRRLLSVALGAMTVAGIACALAPSYELLIVARIFGGLTAALAMPLASGLAATLAPPEARGRALAAVVLGMTIALILGIPLGSVVGSLAGWRATFGFAAVLSLLALVAIAIVLPRVPGVAGPARNPVGLLRLAPVRANLSITLLSFIAIFTVVAFVGPVTTAITGHDGSAIGAFQSASGLGSLLGVILGGRMAGGRHAQAMVVGAFMVMIATQATISLLMLAAPAPSLGLDLLLGVLLLAGATALFCLMPVVQLRLVGAAGAAATLALALNGSTNFIGQGLGAALSSLVISRLGLEAIGFGGAVVAAVAVVLLLMRGAAARARSRPVATRAR